jgi:adenine deaminase
MPRTSSSARVSLTLTYTSNIEYTKLVPGELARLSVPRGTTTVLADANCIANVLGPEGMDYMATTSAPLRIFQQVSHKVPSGSPEIELGGVSIPTETLCKRVSTSHAATLGESNPFSLDLASAQKQAAALHAGKRITGNTALLENEPLGAYAAGGISGDHNAHRPEHVIERLRLGLMLTVMSGSMNSNIESVFKGIVMYKQGLNHMSFCADDKFVEDLDRGKVISTTMYERRSSWASIQSKHTELRHSTQLCTIDWIT